MKGDSAECEVATQRTVHRAICTQPRCNFKIAFADGEHGVEDAAKVARGKALVHEGQYPGHVVDLREVTEP